MKKIPVIVCIAYESRFHIMVHVKWPSPSFKVDLEYENDEYYEKRFLPAYSTALRAPKTRGGKKKYFFKTLYGPLCQPPLFCQSITHLCHKKFP